MQLYARRHFLTPTLNIEVYNDRVMAVVRCEAQVCYCCILKLDLKFVDVLDNENIFSLNLSFRL